MSDSTAARKRRIEEEAEDQSHGQVNRLTSLLPTSAGGLQARKHAGGEDRRSTSAVDGQQKTSQKGKSLLGLDRLAAEKRLEQQQH